MSRALLLLLSLVLNATLAAQTFTLDRAFAPAFAHGRSASMGTLLPDGTYYPRDGRGRYLADGTLDPAWSLDPAFSGWTPLSGLADGRLFGVPRSRRTVPRAS